jgi:hypothetical protein
MEEYFDINKISIRLINKDVAKNMIIKNHYSHKWTMCTYSFGIFYKTGKDHNFFDNEEEKLIGTCVYGFPVGRQAATSICDGVGFGEVLELTRLFIYDGYGKNIESYVISHTMKEIKKLDNKIKIILSYSDDEQGHKGTIYQACNFLFVGRNSDNNLMPNYSISLTGKEDGYNWIHSRTVFERYGSHNIEHLKKKIKKTFYRKKEASKLKYIYILSSSKKEKKMLLKNLKYKPISYPKNNVYNEEIETIVVNDVEKSNNFF